MASVLVANQSASQTASLCNYLTNEKLNIVGTTNEISTLEKYNKIRPDIFILNTNLNYIDIIDNLCMEKNEKRNCNTLLVTNSSECHINNVSKVYKIFTETKLQDIADTVEEMCNYTLERKIDLVLLKTKIYEANGAKYVKEALKKCYYNPKLLNDIDELFELISKDEEKGFNTSSKAVRSAFRTALSHTNAFKEDDPSFYIFKYFNKKENITPRVFLNVVTGYLNSQK